MKKGSSMNAVKTAGKRSLLFALMAVITCIWPAVTVSSEETAISQTRTPTKNQVSRMSPGELKSRLDEGRSIMIVDVRPGSDFVQHHIAGAVSIPLEHIKSRLNDLPRDREIVFY